MSYLEESAKTNRSILDLSRYWQNSNENDPNNPYNKIKGTIEELNSAYDNRSGIAKTYFDKGLALGDKGITSTYNSILAYKSNINQQKKSLNQGQGGSSSVLGGTVN